MLTSNVCVDARATWAIRFLAQIGIPSTLSEVRESKIWVAGDSFEAFLRATNSSDASVIITSHRVSAKVLNIRALRRDSRYLRVHGLDGVYLSSLPVVGITSPSLKTHPWVAHLDHKGREIPGTGVVEFSHGDKIILSVPWDLNIAPERRWSRRLFYRRVFLSGLETTEISSGIENQVFRILFELVTRRAFQIAGLPFEAISPKFREGAVSVLRIDADGFSKTEVINLAATDKRFGNRFSWYLDYLPWLEALGLDSDEWFFLTEGSVNPHCYFHQTFFLKSENKKNFRLAIQAGEKTKAKATGTVSPFGMWTRGYSRALVEMGFKYSSEFAVSEFDLPFLIDDAILQIPVSSLSLGSSNQSAELWKHRKLEAIEQAELTGSVRLYEHPLDLHDEERANLEAHLEWLLTFTELITMDKFAERWLKREALFKAILVGNENLVASIAADFLRRIEVHSEDWRNPPIDIPSRFPASRLLKSAVPNYKRSIFYFLLSTLPLRAFLVWRQIRRFIVSSRPG